MTPGRKKHHGLTQLSTDREAVNAAGKGNICMQRRFIGNDIVDLKTEDVRGKADDARFMARVFSFAEQAAIRRSAHADALLWAFWAAREATYKAVCKAAPGVSSAPRRYPAAMDFHYRKNRPETGTGQVSTPLGTVPVRIFFNAEWVHCLAWAGFPENPGANSFDEDIIYGIREIAPDHRPVCVRESAAARTAATERIAGLLDMDPYDIRIRREPGLHGPGPPRVFIKGEKTPMDISLSHDGRFAAYAFYTGGIATHQSTRSMRVLPDETAAPLNFSNSGVALKQ
jgi:phosphopantetheinyl transferase (holo-ACP synthase)